MQRKDSAISRAFVLVCVLILVYWVYGGVVWVWDWYFTTGGYSPEWWPRLGKFLWRNLSIVIVLYGIACMQASGLAELRFRKNYLLAFGLALILTPPGMMLVYGHKK